jgi:hypothetical protein
MAMPSLKDAVRLLQRAAQPNAGVVLDILHFVRSGGVIAETADARSQAHRRGAAERRTEGASPRSAARSRQRANASGAGGISPP